MSRTREAGTPKVSFKLDSVTFSLSFWQSDKEISYTQYIEHFENRHTKIMEGLLIES